MSKDLNELVETYLNDAHSIEEQALRQLRNAPAIAGSPSFAQALHDHLKVTEAQEQKIRALLEARGKTPSHFKDSIMRAGGAAMVLFAKLQPDTPGKLAAHALSYEAFEFAAYDLLARTAQRAGQSDVVNVALAIRAEEEAMMRRIEGVWDSIVNSTLRGIPPAELPDRLKVYLADAHAIETQSIRLLESSAGMVEKEPVLAAVFSEHLLESQQHKHQIEHCLDELGGKRSLLKDTALRIGALEWGAFFRSHSDTAGKITVFAFAHEYLEIGGYEQLRRVAEQAGEPAIAGTVQTIIGQERRAAQKLAEAFDLAADAALAEQGVG